MTFGIVALAVFGPELLFFNNREEANVYALQETSYLLSLEDRRCRAA